MLEKHRGQKGENAVYKHFLLFLQCFLLQSKRQI